VRLLAVVDDLARLPVGLRPHQLIAHMVVLRLGRIGQQPWLFRRLDRSWICGITPAHGANGALADTLACEVVRAVRGRDDEARRQSRRGGAEKNVLPERLPNALASLFDLPARRLIRLDGGAVAANDIAHLLATLQHEVEGRSHRHGEAKGRAWGKVEDLLCRRRLLLRRRRVQWRLWRRGLHEFGHRPGREVLGRRGHGRQGLLLRGTAETEEEEGQDKPAHYASFCPNAGR